MEVLNAVALEMPCPTCGRTYLVPVLQVMESREMLNEGCACRSETECPPLYLSSLLSPDDLETLRETWARLSRQARAHGGQLILRVRDGP